MTEAVQLDMQAILVRLPHRYPFLLVDRVLELLPGESIRAVKNVTYNEPFFPGHFPGRPVMPGVMIIEALAQAASILCFVTTNVIPTTTRSSTSSASMTRASGGRWYPATSCCSPRSSSARSRASGASPPWHWWAMRRRRTPR